MTEAELLQLIYEAQLQENELVARSIGVLVVLCVLLLWLGCLPMRDRL